MKVADASLTSGWEAELARIEQGELTQKEFLDGVLETVNEVTGEISGNFRKMDSRMVPYRRLGGRYGTEEVQTGVCASFYICTRYVFPLLSGKGLGLPRFCRKAAPFRGWSAKRKSSSLRCGIFFCQALRKKAIQGRRPIKSGKHIPNGIIHS